MQARERLKDQQEVGKAGRTVSGIVNSIEALEGGGAIDS